MNETEHKLNLFDPNDFHVQFTFDNGSVKDIFKYNIKRTELPSIQFGITTIQKGGKTIYLKGDSLDEGVLNLDILLD